MFDLLAKPVDRVQAQSVAGGAAAGGAAAVPSFVLAATLFVSGCAINGNTLPQIADDKSIVTESVTKGATPAGIAKGDAEVIKSAVADAPIEERIKPLAWSNPQTGSTGTIVAIDKFMGKHGQQCRGFKTSVDTFMGIAFYNGEACQISPGEWVLSWFKSSD